MFGSLDNFYFSVIQLGYYLPFIGENMVTAEYLIKVTKNVYWCPKSSDVKAGGARTVKKRTKV